MKRESRIGHWVFLAGFVVAIIAGLVPKLQTDVVMWLLVVAGFIVGILNITAKESQEFLVASVALVVAASSAIAVLPILTAVLKNIILFVFPAALFVAVKVIWELASA